jgi:hypothetical protein
LQYKFCLPTHSISTSADTENLKSYPYDQTLPKWLLLNQPPNWLLSDTLPPWFHTEGTPKWLSDEGFNPPAWMREDEIPHVITNSYGSEGPPLWLLNMEYLPEVDNILHTYINVSIDKKEGMEPIYI